jgi:hypothetical protein
VRNVKIKISAFHCFKKWATVGISKPIARPCHLRIRKIIIRSYLCVYNDNLVSLKKLMFADLCLMHYAFYCKAENINYFPVAKMAILLCIMFDDIHEKILGILFPCHVIQSFTFLATRDKILFALQNGITCIMHAARTRRYMY